MGYFNLKTCTKVQSQEEMFYCVGMKPRAKITIEMKYIHRLFISFAVVFGLLFGYGSALAETCLCLAHSAQQQEHACCQKAKPSHHQEGVRQQKIQTKKACVCAGEFESQLLSSVTSNAQKHFPVLLGMIALLVSLLPLAASRQKPLWLRRIFYPDKTRLYLEKQALLL